MVRPRFPRPLTRISLTQRSGSTRCLSSRHKSVPRSAIASRGQPVSDQSSRGSYWQDGSWKYVSPLLSVIGTIAILGWVERQFESFPAYADDRIRQKAIQELRNVLGDDLVDTDLETRQDRGQSTWSTTNSEVLPDAVVWPKSTQEVQKIVEIASKHRVPVIPISGRSSLEGNFSAPYGGICIDFRDMDHLIALYPDDLQVTVGPGLGWMDLNEKIKDTGLFFPVDPGPPAQFGGMVNTNCSGTNAVRYGTMRDSVVNLTVVLMDGRVIKTRQRPNKSSAGLDLTRFFVGSEGTLGIVTEMTLKLVPIPETTRVAVVPFPSVKDACSAVHAIRRAGLQLQCIELMDDKKMQVLNAYLPSSSRKWEVADTLFLKFSGTQAHVKDDITRASSIIKRNGGYKLTFARDDNEATEMWRARKESLWAMQAQAREGDVVFSTDVCVPPSLLPDLIDQCKKDLGALNLYLATMLGHVGDGNFHCSVLYNPKDAAETLRVKAFVEDMVEKARLLEGTCTGEHGIGIGKKQALIRELGEENVELQRQIKSTFDPQWLLNPGKVFDPPKTRTKPT